MGCNIYIRKKLVVDCSVGMFETLYDMIHEYAEQNNLYKNINFKNLLHEMFVAKESMCSYGFDFADYVHDPYAIELFLQVLNDLMPEFRNQFSEHAIENILLLKDELISYQSTLSQ